MVKEDIILLNASGSSIFRLRLVFGQCRLRFMCCMILIRVSHPAQQGPFPPTLGIRSLGRAASSGCLFYGSTRRPWDIATTSWACLVALSVWCLWTSTIGEPAPVCLRRTALGSGWHPATGHVRCWREKMAASRHKCYGELAKLAASDSLQEAVFTVMEDAE